MSGQERWPFPLAAALAALDSAVIGILVADAEGVIRYVNAAYTQITGVAAEKRLGCNLFDSSTLGAGAQALRTRQPVLRVRHRPPGAHSETLSSASPILLEDELIGVVVFFQDVTELSRLTERLQRTVEVNASLADKFDGLSRARYTFDDLVGTHPKLRAALDLARKAALGDSTVLIIGETGTGKELVAHAIHNASRRRHGPFIAVNCAAVPESLMESEFFGHERGAFTGADRRRPGYLELADRGTLFLDELGELGTGLQSKLLRFLHSGEFTPVGAGRSTRADVRLISATNRQLERMVEEGKMRADLFFRLNVVRIHLPPLRDRPEDIPALVYALLPRLARKAGKPVPKVEPAVIQRLQGYAWPGNVRELENVLERALNLLDGEVITLDQLGLPPATPAIWTDILPLAELERRMIERALQRYGNTVEGKRRAASALGISLTTLYSKLRAARPLRFAKTENEN